MYLLDDQAFSIELMDEGTQTTSSRSRICHNGKPTDATIEGAFLEACVKIEKFYLVFIAEDSIYQESLSICLLNENLYSLDTMLLFQQYSTGTFRLRELKAPDRVVFEFLGEDRKSVV